LQPSVLAIQAAAAALLLVAVVVHGVVLVECMCLMYGLAHLMTFEESCFFRVLALRSSCIMDQIL
jgi:hypothetical protein